MTFWNVLLGLLIGHLAARYFFEAIFERGNSSALRRKRECIRRQIKR